MKGPRIRLDGVSVAYGHTIAVSNVSGVFESGSLTAVVGPNGAGKSTLLKALMGDIKLRSGAIDRQGFRARDVGYLPQAAQIERSFPISVADVLMLGAWKETGLFGGVSRKTAGRGKLALERVGLSGFEQKQVDTLSAGQFQRLLFARLLLQDSQIIILDEPFTAIDAATTSHLLDLIGEWHREGRTVIAVLHDFEQVRRYFPQSLLLAREMIGWGPTENVMSQVNLLKAHAVADNFDATTIMPERMRA